MKVARNPFDRFHCGPVTFSGSSDALYERHLIFDQVAPLAPPRRASNSRPSHARCATCCRSAGSVAEQTYLARSVKRVYTSRSSS